MTGLEVVVVKKKKKKFQFPVMPFVPDHMAAPSEGGGILPTQAPFSSAEAATAAPSSCSHGRPRETKSSPPLSDSGRVKP